MESKLDKIKRLKEEKNAVILAHYYVNDEVQDIADYVGDSYYLSELATRISQDVIVLCGVRFMAESAKILNMGKKVLLPVVDADCPMAHMATVDKIKAIRERFEDVAVVCYVNSTAELKEQSDVCVTSSNALKIVKALPNKNIYFIPDQNLAHYVASKVPEKNFIFNDGYCPVHMHVEAAEVQAVKDAHPGAPVLVHPECKPEVIALSDYAGSTSGIINYVKESEKEEFIICTEKGVLHKIKTQNPDKKLYLASEKLLCVDMKKITLDSVIDALETGKPEIEMDDEFAKRAYESMARMLELSK